MPQDTQGYHFTEDFARAFFNHDPFPARDLRQMLVRRGHECCPRTDAAPIFSPFLENLLVGELRARISMAPCEAALPVKQKKVLNEVPFRIEAVLKLHPRVFGIVEVDHLRIRANLVRADVTRLEGNPDTDGLDMPPSHVLDASESHFITVGHDGPGDWRTVHLGNGLQLAAEPSPNTGTLYRLAYDLENVKVDVGTRMQPYHYIFPISIGLRHNLLPSENQFAEVPSAAIVLFGPTLCFTNPCQWQNAVSRLFPHGLNEVEDLEGDWITLNQRLVAANNPAGVPEPMRRA